MFEFPLLPEASATASHTDALFLGLVIGAGIIVLMVTGLILIFSVRYRKGSARTRPTLSPALRKRFENGWTIATGVAFLALFWWAASQNFTRLAPPEDPLQIRVIGKQWMWKVQHPGGQREINELHVPVDEPVRLLMDSQDVIHSFFVPAFRLKEDVVPGITRAMHFTPTKTGTFHLFCAEYCGTQHSGMTGKVVVMEQEAYAKWLQTADMGDDLALQGKQLFTRLGCAGCHFSGSVARAPDLKGVYGSPVPLSDDRVIVADDKYLYDSIVQPKRDVVAGFKPIMPSFAGKVDQAELVALVAYIKSLNAEGEASR